MTGGEDTPEARRAIGQRIAEARAAIGTANASLFADQLGVRPNTVYRWERGELVPSIFTLYRIAQLAGVTMEWLVGGTETPADPHLERWIRTPTGQTAPAEALAFLRSLPLRGYVPSDLFWDLALTAWRAGLAPDDASRAARTTERHR